jgi:large subunit ribosomal protein L29
VISLGKRARELRGVREQELDVRLNDARHEIFNLRFQHATGALENAARVRQVKRDIARILTIQNERKRGE